MGFLFVGISIFHYPVKGIAKKKFLYYLTRSLQRSANNFLSPVNNHSAYFSNRVLFLTLN